MALCVNAVQGTESSQIVRMIEDICGRDVIILIDSSSSHNFIDVSLASRWRKWSTLPSPMQVRVANGQVLWFTHELVD
jgi:hypothetical protein